MSRICPECGDVIVGREDKKFCSDACRNAYNNKINKDSNNYMRNINNRLRKNYRILASLNTEGKTKTTKSRLVSKGFDFDYFTNLLHTKTGNINHKMPTYITTPTRKIRGRTRIKYQKVRNLQ